MIDLDLLKEQMPLTINDFKRITSEQIQLKRDFLQSSWLSECAEIIKENKESIENLTSQNDEVNKFAHSYGCFFFTVPNQPIFAFFYFMN